jgi:hypothetical protein
MLVSYRLRCPSFPARTTCMRWIRRCFHLHVFARWIVFPMPTLWHHFLSAPITLHASWILLVSATTITSGVTSRSSRAQRPGIWATRVWVHTPWSGTRQLIVTAKHITVPILPGIARLCRSHALLKEKIAEIRRYLTWLWFRMRSTSSFRLVWKRTVSSHWSFKRG